jgi:PAS domain S-box-containing protein
MLLSTLLALGLFAVDLMLPLGVAAGILYVAVVFVASWSPQRRDILLVAAACSGLTILGFFLSSPGNVTPWMVQLNRALALFAIWVTAMVLLQRKQVEEGLRQSATRLRSVIDTAVEGIIIIDERGVIESFNPAAEHLFGYSAAEVIGQNVRVLMPSPYREEHDHYIARYLSTGEKKIIGIGRETVARRKDGTVFHVALAVSEMRLGNQRMFTGMVRDITARVQAAEALRKAHDELEQRVVERTAALQEANEEVKRFAYIVSHDLRAPLLNIKGFAGELRTACGTIQAALPGALPHLEPQQREGVARALQEEVPEALRFIDTAVTRMDSLIRALLQLSRLGHRELRFELVPMEALVKESLQTLEHQITQRRAHVTVGPLPHVRADRLAMEQIMGNLLSNAVAYLEPGRPGEISITAERRAAVTVFCVRDNGRGIAAEDIPKVFEPFRRVGRQDVPGEGMGLAYVRTLVRRHGGDIWCCSTPGAGTTFSFSIAQYPASGGTHAA